MDNYEFLSGLGKISRKSSKAAKGRPKKLQPEEEEEQEEPSPKKGKKDGKPKPRKVEQIDIGIGVIRRFVNLVGKAKPAAQIATFIRFLQKQMYQRVLTHRHPYASEILQVQSILVGTYNRAKTDTITIKIDRDDYEHLYRISRTEKVRPSVGFLKRYVSVVARPYNRDTKQKMKTLLENLQTMFEKKLIAGNDPYIEQVKKAGNELQRGLSNNAPVKVSVNELNGISGIIGQETSGSFRPFNSGGGSEEEDLSGVSPADAAPVVDTEDNNKPLTAKQMCNLEFEQLPFTGYYQKLLGNPERNFYLNIFAAPWTGKTTFTLLLVKYLSENFGKVLYIWPEQYRTLSGINLCELTGVSESETLTMVKSIEHEPDIEKYAFVVFDSVHSLQFEPEDVLRFRERFPMIGVIAVLQTNKMLKFKGSQGWWHDCDIQLQIADKKVHTIKNRYLVHAPEPMAIPFQQEKKQEPESNTPELNGVKKKAGNKKSEIWFDKAVLSGTDELINVPEISIRKEPGLTMPEKIKVNSSTSVANLFKQIVGDQVTIQEHFVVLYLNTTYNLVGFYKHAKGRIDATLADRRLIIGLALKSLATVIIIGHNHPSGSAAPSDGDRKLTQAFMDACKLMEITLLDHIIFTESNYYYSFADEGIL